MLNVPPPYGGGEIVNQYLADSLNARYKIVRWSQENATKSTQGEFLGMNVFSSLKKGGLILRLIFRDRPNVILIGLGKNLWSYVRDVLFATVAGLFGMRVIGDLHGMGFSFLGGSRMETTFLKCTINRFSAIRTLGDEIKSGLQFHGYRGRVYVIDNGIVPGIQTDFYQPRVRSGPLKLLYLGEISESKGIYRCLNVVASLKEQEIASYLTVVGEWLNQETRQNVVDAIEARGLYSSVQVKGRILGKQKWELISQQDMLLHLTDWDGQPLSILETMSIGIPTISTYVGAIPETISTGINGFLVRNKLDDSVEILRDIYSGKIDYSSVSRNCFDTFKKRYTVEILSKNVNEMLEKELNLAVASK